MKMIWHVYWQNLCKFGIQLDLVGIKTVYAFRKIDYKYDCSLKYCRIRADSSGLVLPSCAVETAQQDNYIPASPMLCEGNSIFCPPVAAEGLNILNVSVSLVKEEKENYSGTF